MNHVQEFNDLPPSYAQVVLNVNTLEPQLSTQFEFYPPQEPFTSNWSINRALANNEFLFVQLNPIGLLTKELSVQIKNSNNHPLITVSAILGQYRSTNRTASLPRDEYVGGRTRFMDIFGAILLNAEETHENNISVSSGNFVLGTLNRFGLFSSEITARNSNNQILFTIVRAPAQDSSILYNIMKGQEVIGKFNEGPQSTNLTIESHVMDERVRGLIVVAVFTLFTKYHAETTVGIGGGEKGILMTKCCGSIIFAIVFISICLAVWFYYK